MSNEHKEDFEISKFENMLIGVRQLELAMENFNKDRMVFQAKRVQKAYKNLRKELNQLLLRCEDKHHEPIIRFLFHVNDWLELYKHSMQTSQRSLLDPIKLNLLDKMEAYPAEWIEEIRSAFDEPNWHNEQLKW
ncbi:MAG: hypothetical protein MI784_00875 [Cytophagales bacterium]|nr:hypothetical protein [Cytophagales bacterium]